MRFRPNRGTFRSSVAPYNGANLPAPSAENRAITGTKGGRGGFLKRTTSLCFGLAALVLSACTGGSGGDGAPDDGRRSDDRVAATATPERVGPPSGRPTPTPQPVTIAFAGDVHFEGVLEGRLEHPATAMGPLTRALTRADVAIVNLESAVTSRGTPEVKDYTFRAPPTALRALAAAGIDVVTMANNHALDYGPVSVADALSAAQDVDVPVIGIGFNAVEAFRPWVTSVHGQRIAFLAATSVVDAALVPSWSASPDHAGVSTALDGDNAALVAAIERVRPHVDTVVVDMHYGSDLSQCPTDIQRGVVKDAVRAGADIVIGQHAHVLLGAGYQGSAYVDYGLGNFQFYSAAGPTAETGVLTLTVNGRKVTKPSWLPGTIVSGLPIALGQAASDEAISRWQRLRACTGLTATPSTSVQQR